MKLNTLKLGVVMLNLLLLSGTSFAGPKEVKACLREALDKPNPVFQVSDAPSSVDKASRYLVVICNGNGAKELFKSINTVPTEGEWSGKTRGDFKYLSEGNDPSMCYHINTNSDGVIVDDYNCSIRLSLNPEMLGKTSEREMKPFDLKEQPEPKKEVTKVGF